MERGLKKKARDALGEVVARVVEVGGAGVAHAGFHALADDEARLIHEIFVVAEVHESARDDVGGFVRGTSSLYNAGMSKGIVMNSDIRFGAPCVEGTRISVADILGYISSGDSVDAIVKNFPELTKEKVLSALDYAAHMLNVTATLEASHEASSRQ